MEHFGALLKRCLNEFSTTSRVIEEVWEHVWYISSDFSVEDCMALYKSMRACHKELLLYWLLETIRWIIKVQRIRLNNIEYFVEEANFIVDCKLLKIF